MPRFLLLVLALVALAALLPPALGAASIDTPSGPDDPRALSSAPVRAKIQPGLLELLQNGETSRALVVFAEQADVTAARGLPGKAEKGRYVFDATRAVANRTQAGVRALLDTMGVKYRAYYVANVIAVENMDANLAALLAARAEVGRISSNADVHFSEPVSRVPAPEAAAAAEWGIQKIRAIDLWEHGFKGKGIVVANQDTGVQWMHPALKKHYRGYNAATGKGNHNYNWWDAVHNDIDGSANPCGYNIKKPCDDNGHGTHTIGTVAGKAPGNKIGVAFKSKWISCRNMDSGTGRASTYIECFEFFLAPWDKRGNNPNPDMAPDIVSNSWGCPPTELCDPDSIQTATENVRAAGIFVSVSAGNEGPACSTVAAPSAIYDAATTVGATDMNDTLASFSSRGPVVVDGSQRLKPDISAPGVNVRSSIPNNAYANFSGTSMAAPHVAGAVALLWDAVPALIGDVDGTEAALFGTAKAQVNAGAIPCGVTDSSDIPNNLFGYGRLDVWKAYQSTLP
jgi:subtilisin family serine protease